MKQVSMAALCGGFFVFQSVYAETLCGVREDLVSSLRNEYAEVETGRGLTPDRRLVELFHSIEGSFTILVTASTGVSCIVAVGQDWETVPYPAIDLPFFPNRMH